MKDIALSQNNPTPYHNPSVSTSTNPAIGIDIGGTKINAAIIKSDLDDSLISLIHQPTPTDPEVFLNTLVRMVKTLQGVQAVSTVGIATAGVVDSIHGEILGSTGNMPALQSISHLKILLEERLQLPVHLENDANAAAYGEWRVGAGKGSDNMFTITLGTGVGMGIVFDGKMYRGSHFYAGEGGHLAISHHRERKCTCGRWDCWEAFASGTGLQKTAQLAWEAAVESEQIDFLNRYCPENEITTYAVVAAYKDKNSLGLAIMDDWHHHIAVGLGSLINVMDPQIIVVGGGLGQFVSFERLLERTRERTMSHTFQVVPATLGNYAGIVGAAYLAMESM